MFVNVDADVITKNFAIHDFPVPGLPHVHIDGIYSFLDNRQYVLVDSAAIAIKRKPKDFLLWLDTFQTHYDDTVHRRHTFELNGVVNSFVLLNYAIMYWQYWGLKGNQKARRLALATYCLFSGTPML